MSEVSIFPSSGAYLSRLVRPKNGSLKLVMLEVVMGEVRRRKEDHSVLRCLLCTAEGSVGYTHSTIHAAQNKESVVKGVA